MGTVPVVDTTMPSGDIKANDVLVTYDRTHDVVTVTYADVVIASAADAERVRQLVHRQLLPFGKKVDLLIDLGGLTVKPSGARAFGEMRAWLLNEHALSNVRYGGNAQTKSTVFTSAVIDNVSGTVVSTREEALRVMLGIRAQRPSNRLRPKVG